MTATELLAAAMGLASGGPQRCAFCGARASEPYSPLDSFTALDTLACPGSGHICAGCQVAMTATEGQSPDGKPWMWSWVLTTDKADRLALCVMLGGERVKAGRSALRAACLSPPPAPYAIVLCQAGRTHTLYRTAVHHGGPGATVNLDGVVIRYQPAGLTERIALCERVASTFGPKAARDVLPITAGRWLPENIDLIEAWHTALDCPLTAVAACLFDDPSKGES